MELLYVKFAHSWDERLGQFFHNNKASKFLINRNIKLIVSSKGVSNLYV